MTNSSGEWANSVLDSVESPSKGDDWTPAGSSTNFIVPENLLESR